MRRSEECGGFVWNMIDIAEKFSAARLKLHGHIMGRDKED
jgi:hypothetical protein